MLTKKHALDDDFESPRNVITESNVDYLSYKFDEMDLAASWRVLTKQKLTIVNGIRLENASWRTWAKQRNNLKTVSPETLNWLKDSDVTWLYGPLHIVIKNMDEEDHFNNERPGASPIQGQKPLKSALKKVTMSDLLKRSASELQLNSKLSNGISISEANQQLGAFSPAVIASHRQPKLRFNQYVEQCIALSAHDSTKKKTSRVRLTELNDAKHHDDSTSEESSEDDEDNYDPGEDSDAGSVLMMRSSRPPKVRSSIKKIEPALLKTNSRSDRESSGDSDSDVSSDDNLIISTSTHNVYAWDTESAESDALVQHIIRVSKGKKPLGPRDPAADRMPTGGVHYENGYVSSTDGVPNTRSDYDYEFDDDDWDTHSEHPDDIPQGFTVGVETAYPPIAPPPPVGCQIAKAPVMDNEPIFVNPKIEKCVSQMRATDDIHHMQQQYDSSSSTTSGSSNGNSHGSQPNQNVSFFSSIAHWASSHLWPTDKAN
ncbi:MAG: hypothetical protein EXX96DRAFT_508183 [Benjaminiella poitrasii]|nr:MAG: hypothetical protein EXX96DRAFT_508183 [Benjaminiella poitrasii]